MIGKQTPGVTKGRERAVVGAAVAFPLLFVLAWSAVARTTADEPVREWTGRLSAMADDRAASIQRWVDDLRADAALIADYPTVQRTLGAPARTPIRFQDDAGRERHLQDILASAATQHRRENVWILDRQGGIVAAARPGVPDPAIVRAGVSAAASGTGAVTLWWAADREARVVVSAPVRPGADQALLGAVVVETRADEFLFPLLLSEPVPTRTGEAFLVEMEGRVIRFLSPLRKVADRGRRLDPTAAGPAAAALDGLEAAGRFTDYAGDDVLAITRRLEGVPWGLVVKVDRGEALAERRADLVRLSLAFLGLLAGGLGIGYGLWKRHVAATLERMDEQDSRFRWHAERSGDLIYRFRIVPGPGVEYVNAASLTLSGYTPEEIYADPGLLRNIIHPEDRQLFESTLSEPCRSDREPLVLRWIRRDGAVVWLEHRNTAVRDESGAVVGIEGIAREVTARQALEQELTDARDRLQLALHVARQTLFDVDLHAARILVSTVRAAEHGVRPHHQVLSIDEAIATLHPEDRDRMGVILRDLDAGRTESTEAEFRVRTPRGALRWMRMVARVIDRDDDGRARRIIGLHNDITERRLAEDGLRESEERYSALEEEMRHAQKMEAVGRLAGGIAHDFNNVLTSIRGHALMALEDLPAGWPAREDIQEVVRDADRAAALTRQLLTFSRKQVLELRTFDLGEVVVGMESMIRRLIGEDIHLVVERRDCPCTIHADPARLEQVLLNMVVNARDAMPGGGRLTVTVEGGAGTPDRPVVLFRVRDTGTGMDAETMERIFEPFFTTKAVGKGTGLGLSTAYGIVRQSGGDIHVDSAPGLGTTFTMSFSRVLVPEPAVEPPVAAPAPAATVAGTRAYAAAEPARARVLVVEDENAVRELTRRVLDRRGFHVAAAPSPDAALEAAAHGTIEVLLTDVALPGMEGPALATRLGEIHPGLRVIFMSGYPEAVIRARHDLPEGALFLEKPFSPDQLLARVDEALGAGAGLAA